MPLQLQPINQDEAFAFIGQHHRHHKPPQGWLFGIAVNDGVDVVGVAVVGRPVSRHFDDGWTAEVTRLCVIDGAPNNAASMLWGAARRAVFAMGYTRIISYILETESGVSLKAAGWREVKRGVGGGSWSRESRPRVDKHPLGQKSLWEG